jgi:acyl-coenzyme A thioesterase PaaI-like protein
MHLEVDGDVVRGHATYGPAYEGPSGFVHGALVTGAFDELLGQVQMLSGSAGFTGTLTVRLHRPTPLARRIDYEGAVDRVEGRKIFCRGRSTCDGELLSEAEAVFIGRRPTT